MSRTVRLAVFIILDLGCILLALYLGSPLTINPELSVLSDYTGASTFTAFIFLMSYYTLDCYALNKPNDRELLARVVIATVLGTMLTGFVFFISETWRFPRLLYILQFVITLGLTLSWRIAYISIFQRFAAKRKIVFFGADSEGKVAALLAEHMPGAEIVGYVDKVDSIAKSNNPYLGSLTEAVSIAKNHDADLILLLPGAELTGPLAHILLRARLEQRVQVETVGALMEELTMRTPVEHINDEWLLLEDGFNLNTHKLTRHLKWTMDMLMASGLLLILWPFMLATAVAIRLDSPGPVIYRQRRVGLENKEFTLYKFRSMHQDAEKNGAVWAAKNDPRITKVGQFIRKVRLDELPQLINVLKGEMSFIGPRPERPEFVEELSKKIPYYYIRHTVKPGITGWAQVSYPYSDSVEGARMKLEYDLYYIKHMSLFFDCKVFLRTVGVILFPSGSR
jgi:exopolysaccharide biosynthesis polyprenyl glycosylphosphotransferase